MRNDKEASEEIRIGDLLRGLKVSGAWKLAAACVGVIVAAFGLGYKFHADVVVPRATVSAAKNEFFVRYNRYITARDIFNETHLPEDKDRLLRDEKLLFELVDGWWTSQNNFSGELNFQPEVIRKGFDPTKSRVSFADGTEFVIPPEIKSKVLESE